MAWKNKKGSEYEFQHLDDVPDYIPCHILEMYAEEISESDGSLRSQRELTPQPIVIL